MGVRFNVDVLTIWVDVHMRKNDRTSDAAEFTVGELPQSASRRVAVFIAHGMGQQIPFQTMDAVATGLRNRDNDPNAAKPNARAVNVDSDWIHRIEMLLKQGTVDVHIYEAYWAPLTEGRITLRDVIRFLVGAGVNAIRNAKRGTYQRWMFGEFTTFPIATRTLFYLLVTLAVIVSLVLMNTAIVSVAAGTALLGSRPAWLTSALLDDLTTTFNGVVVAMVAAGIALAFGILLRRSNVHRQWRVVWSSIASLFLIVAIFVVILAGISIPIVLYGHIRGGIDEDQRLWVALFSTSGVRWFDENVSAAILWTSVVIGGGVLLLWIGRIIFGIFRDLGAGKGRIGTVAVTVLFASLFGLAATLIVQLWRAIDDLSPAAPTIVASSLTWALLVGLSGIVRTVLVQTLGDVAIYIMPYKLDALNDLRHQIRGVAFKVLKAIYRQKDKNGNSLYDEVVVVGHSLGSVVVYDVLNQMIREDEAANRTDVVDRTPLLVTFGSPLDKTAFIFSLQGQDTSEPREALAASVQPMIRDYRFRPKQWLNVWAPWDIISGHLGFYDPDPATSSKCVENKVDNQATTPIVAHTEYWKGTYVYERIYNAL
jgi:hypothetical protein